MNLVIIDFDALKLEDYIDPYEGPGAMEAILAASIFPDEQKKDSLLSEVFHASTSLLRVMLSCMSETKPSSTKKITALA